MDRLFGFCLSNHLLEVLLAHLRIVIAEVQVGVVGSKHLEYIVLLGGGEVDERILLRKIGVVIGHHQREHQVVCLHICLGSWRVDVVPVVPIQGSVLRKLREGTLIVRPDYTVLAVLLVITLALIIGIVFYACFINNRIVHVGVRDANPSDGVVVVGGS